MTSTSCESCKNDSASCRDSLQTLLNSCIWPACRHHVVSSGDINKRLGHYNLPAFMLQITIYSIYCTQGSIPSPFFIPGLKPSCSANPSHRSLPFLLRDWVHEFPGLLTDTSEHFIRFFTFQFFSTFYFLVPCGRLSLLVSFWLHVKIPSRIVSYRIVCGTVLWKNYVLSDATQRETCRGQWPPLQEGYSG